MACGPAYSPPVCAVAVCVVVAPRVSWQANIATATVAPHVCVPSHGCHAMRYKSYAIFYFGCIFGRWRYLVPGSHPRGSGEWFNGVLNVYVHMKSGCASLPIWDMLLYTADSSESCGASFYNRLNTGEKRTCLQLIRPVFGSRWY